MQLLPEAGGALKYSLVPKPVSTETRPRSHCAIYGWRPNDCIGNAQLETVRARQQLPAEAQAAAKLGYI